MQIVPIKTKIMYPPQDDLYKVLDQFLPVLQEKDVVIITSKILSIHQGHCIPINSVKNKNDLIKQEADIIIPNPEEEIILATIKDNILIPFAGIDESNGNGYYILWPQNPSQEAKKICQYLKQKFSLTDLAVIINDSYLTPMRTGVMGISIGFYGLEPVEDNRGKEDLFGRQIKVSQTNIVDTLSALGSLYMGETKQQIPIVVIRDTEMVQFTDRETHQKITFPAKEDIYYPLLKKYYE